MTPRCTAAPLRRGRSVIGVVFVGGGAGGAAAIAVIAWQHGRFPLHHLVRSSSIVATDLLLSLLSSYPEAVKTPDDNSMLPLHIMLDSPTCDVPTLLTFLEAYPAAVTMVRLQIVPFVLAVVTCRPVIIIADVYPCYCLCLPTPPPHPRDGICARCAAQQSGVAAHSHRSVALRQQSVY